MVEEYTAEEIEQLSGMIGSNAIPEEKHNVHTFLNKVASTIDTTKVGNLTDDEVGKPKLPLRTHKELELFCRDVLEDDVFANYFKKKGEILAATSLSKDAKLITLAITTTRNVSEELKTPQKENKGWFKSKKKSQPISEY